MNNDLEKQIIDSLDDVDLTSKIPDYQVWVFGLDEEKNTITEEIVYSHKDPTVAIIYAKSYVEILKNKNPTSTEVRYYEVLVETVVSFDEEEYEENVATLFYELIETNSTSD